MEKEQNTRRYPVASRQAVARSVVRGEVGPDVGLLASSDDEFVKHTQESCITKETKVRHVYGCRSLIFSLLSRTMPVRSHSIDRDRTERACHGLPSFVFVR